MPYSAISLSPDEVPSCVTELVGRQVDALLRDIFYMLEHPRYNPDAEPGFNLSAASILFGIIGGLSRVFCNGRQPGLALERLNAEIPYAHAGIVVRRHAKHRRRLAIRDIDVMVQLVLVGPPIDQKY